MGFGDGSVGKAREPWMRRLDARERVMAAYNAVMFAALCAVILGLVGEPDLALTYLGWVFVAWAAGVPLAWLASGLWAPAPKAVQAA